MTCQIADKEETKDEKYYEMDFARNVSGKVMFMADGRVIETGPSKAFFEAPKEERSRDFIRAIQEARQ